MSSMYALVVGYSIITICIVIGMLGIRHGIMKGKLKIIQIIMSLVVPYIWWKMSFEISPSVVEFASGWFPFFIAISFGVIGASHFHIKERKPNAT